MIKQFIFNNVGKDKKIVTIPVEYNWNGYFEGTNKTVKLVFNSLQVGLIANSEPVIVSSLNTMANPTSFTSANSSVNIKTETFMNSLDLNTIINFNKIYLHGGVQTTTYNANSLQLSIIITAYYGDLNISAPDQSSVMFATNKISNNTMSFNMVNANFTDNSSLPTIFMRENISKLLFNIAVNIDY